MAVERPVELDAVDWRILAALQRDGRASYADLARAVAMSPSAVAERVRRLEESAVIAGYQAVVDPDRVGLPILAFVRLRYPTGNYRPFHALLESTPEILEAHHVTGEDCFVLKVAAGSMRHLEAVTGRIAGLGAVTTSVVYSSPLTRRDVGAGALPPDAPDLRGSIRGGPTAGWPAPGGAAPGGAAPGGPAAGGARRTGGGVRRRSVAN